MLWRKVPDKVKMQKVSEVLKCAEHAGNNQMGQGAFLQADTVLAEWKQTTGRRSWTGKECKKKIIVGKFPNSEPPKIFHYFPTVYILVNVKCT